MKHASIIEQRRRREPAFDLPPRFAGVDDRRLGGRVLAVWTDRCVGGQLPQAGEFRAALDPEWLPYVVWFDSGAGGLTVREAGTSVAATFNLNAGALSEDTPFERALGHTALRSKRNLAPARLEGGFARSPTKPATLLTRGTVLPLAGTDGNTLCAIITWTEPLPTFDNERLRSELWLSLTAQPDVPSSPTP